MKYAERLIYSAGDLALLLARSSELTEGEAEAVKLMASLMLHSIGMPEGYMRFVVPCYPEGIDRTLTEHICMACYELGK